MKDFRTLFPHSVSFGAGEAKKIGQIIKAKSALVMGGRRVKQISYVNAILQNVKENAKNVIEYWSVPSEPSEKEVTDTVSEIDSLFHGKPDTIIAIGGGSVMDMAKFVSVMVGNGSGMNELFAGKLPERRQTGLIMIPTTAGTGSEATPIAVALRPALNLKVGVVCKAFMPDAVALDPELLTDLPAAITAATGMDALCHALECYVSNKANPLSDLFALEALRLLFGSLKKAYLNGKNLEARSRTLLAAFYGGICIASSGTNAVHALSFPLGGRYKIAHGVANAVLLAPAFASNKDSCIEKLAKVAEIAAAEKRESLAGKSDSQKADYLIDTLAELSRELHIPSTLEELGVPADNLDILADSAFEVKRLLNNNPKPLEKDDIRKIYQSILKKGDLSHK